MGYQYSLKITAQANTVEDLIRTLDEAKEQLAGGYAMAHDENDDRWYALSLDKEESSATK